MIMEEWDDGPSRPFWNHILGHEPEPDPLMLRAIEVAKKLDELRGSHDL